MAESLAGGGAPNLRSKVHDAEKAVVRLGFARNSDQTEVLAEQVKAVSTVLDTIVNQGLLHDFACQRNAAHGNTLSGRVNILKVSADSFNEGAAI